MIVTFTYKDKTYTTNDLERKLEKLGATADDIMIRKKTDCRIGEPDRERTLYRFYNSETKETIVSIYDNLEHLKQLVDIENFSIINQ